MYYHDYTVLLYTILLQVMEKVQFIPFMDISDILSKFLIQYTVLKFCKVR